MYTNEDNDCPELKPCPVCGSSVLSLERTSSSLALDGRAAAEHEKGNAHYKTQSAPGGLPEVDVLLVGEGAGYRAHRTAEDGSRHDAPADQCRAGGADSSSYPGTAQCAVSRHAPAGAKHPGKQENG